MSRAARGGFDINGLGNGKLLKGTPRSFSDELFEDGFRHFNNHPVYNRQVAERVEQFARTVKPSTKNSDIAGWFQMLARELDAAIESGAIKVR